MTYRQTVEAIAKHYGEMQRKIGLYGESTSILNKLDYYEEFINAVGTELAISAIEHKSTLIAGEVKPEEEGWLGIGGGA